MSRWHIDNDPNTILAEAKEEASVKPLSDSRWLHYQNELESIGISEQTAREVLNYAAYGFGDVVPARPTST